jgi:hypothetical protein
MFMHRRAWGERPLLPLRERSRSLRTHSPRLHNEPGPRAELCAHVRGQVLGLASSSVPDLIRFPASVPVAVGIEFLLPGSEPIQ